MMSKYFVCCEKCFEKISRRSTNAAKWWMDLCTTHLNNSEKTITVIGDNPNLRLLETLGFLVSTETDDCIYINVKGHMRSEDGEHFFCPKGGMHV